jgi:hypothetical protein
MLSIGEIKSKIDWHKEEIFINEQKIRMCERKISNSKHELELYRQDLIKAENIERQKKTSAQKDTN